VDCIGGVVVGACWDGFIGVAITILELEKYKKTRKTRKNYSRR
jgi:hypothetical protein